MVYNDNEVVERNEFFMRYALTEAHHAAEKGEVPVGAVIVAEDKIIGRGHNTVITDGNISAHAEINALRSGSAYMNNYRLPDCTLYVTLEPCLMCAGAIIHARVGALVFGVFDDKSGAFGSIINVFEQRWNHHCREVQSGVLMDQCRTLLTQFFRQLRVQKKR